MKYYIQNVSEFLTPTYSEIPAESEKYTKQNYEEWKRKILEERETED